MVIISMIKMHSFYQINKVIIILGDLNIVIIWFLEQINDGVQFKI